MTITVDVRPVPTGGAILLDFSRGEAVSSLTGPATISRSVVGGQPVQIWTGQAEDMYLFLDANDGQPGPLPGGVSYTYTITDSTGTLTTDPVTVVGRITLIQQNETGLLARLLEAAVLNIVLPPLITERPSVTTAMPIVGLPALPILVVNQDLLQQEEVPIGQDFEPPNPDGTLTIGGYAKFMWRVSVLCKNAPSRDFWKDAVIAIFSSLCGSVFAPVGKNMTHRFQAACYQVVKSADNLQPGFYGADVMLELTGLLNTTIETNYLQTANIDFTARFPDGVTTEVVLPLAH